MYDLIVLFLVAVTAFAVIMSTVKVDRKEFYSCFAVPEKVECVSLKRVNISIHANSTSTLATDSTARVGFNREGIKIIHIFPFRFLIPDSVIPWGEVKDIRVHKLLGVYGVYVLEFNCCNSRLIISKRIGDEIIETWKESIRSE